VNPVKVPERHELYTAQPITFASIDNAKNFTTKSNVEIVVASTQYSEDKTVIPINILQLSDLTRTVNDINANLSSRKFPLIQDILNKSKEVEGTDYLIYTNIDIGLMPYFYNTIIGYIEKGHDAIIVNKRRLVADYNNVNQLPDIYADAGKSHPGFDCFIFKSELLEKFVLNDICVGVPFLGVSMFHNLVAHSQNPLIITNAHLTFHIGMNVLGFKKDEYYLHNKTTYFTKIHPEIKNKFDLSKFPYTDEKKLNRLIKWILNPSIFTVDYLNLEGKSSLQKAKLKLEEIRWQILQR